MLQKYLDSTSPPVLRATVVKLADTRKRLVGVNSTSYPPSPCFLRGEVAMADGLYLDALLAVQNRINRVYLQLSRQRIPAS